MKWDEGETLKQKFVKPTGEDKKIIFFKDLRKTPPLVLTDTLF